MQATGVSRAVADGTKMNHALATYAAGMQISVVSGVGHGSTLLSSFDDALRRCGVYNYNLIPLSSVIPPGSEIVDGYDAPDNEFGHRLYVVKAEARSAEIGCAVAAGIGWYQWCDGRGVFVEHEVVGDTCHEASEEVALLIRSSLRDLCFARNVPFDEARVRCRITGADVIAGPTTSLVLCVYHAEGWS
jgi:arginine decarboxylase